MNQNAIDKFVQPPFFKKNGILLTLRLLHLFDVNLFENKVEPFFFKKKIGIACSPLFEFLSIEIRKQPSASVNPVTHHLEREICGLKEISLIPLRIEMEASCLTGDQPVR